MLSQFFMSSGSQAPYWLDGKHVVIWEGAHLSCTSCQGVMLSFCGIIASLAWLPFFRIRHCQACEKSKQRCPETHCSTDVLTCCAGPGRL